MERVLKVTYDLWNTWSKDKNTDRIDWSLSRNYPIKAYEFRINRLPYIDLILSVSFPAYASNICKVIHSEEGEVLLQMQGRYPFMSLPQDGISGWESFMNQVPFVLTEKCHGWNNLYERAYGSRPFIENYRR